jgi:hypothetical protein
MASKNPLLGGAAGVAALFDRSLGPLMSLTGTAGAPSPATAPNSALASQLTTITQQLEQLRTIHQTQIETMRNNTLAVENNSTTRGTGGGSTASSIGGALQGMFGFGLGLSPLISGLVSLFGGGGDSEPAPLARFVMPLPVQANAGISAANPGEVFAVDNAAGGVPRPAPAASPAAQVTVQVHAMDSRSFLDHSHEIAMAVRQAMLETSVLNDVIRGV